MTCRVVLAVGAASLCTVLTSLPATAHAASRPPVGGCSSLEPRQASGTYSIDSAGRYAFVLSGTSRTSLTGGIRTTVTVSRSSLPGVADWPLGTYTVGAARRVTPNRDQQPATGRAPIAVVRFISTGVKFGYGTRSCAFELAAR